jgi:uncharacterized Tic20 family protein
MRSAALSIFFSWLMIPFVFTTGRRIRMNFIRWQQLKKAQEWIDRAAEEIHNEIWRLENDS